MSMAEELIWDFFSSNFTGREGKRDGWGGDKRQEQLPFLHVLPGIQGEES